MNKKTAYSAIVGALLLAVISAIGRRDRASITGVEVR